MPLPNREQLNLAAHNTLRRVARRAGLDVTRADAYSPLVAPADLAPDTWEVAAPMPGLELDLPAQLEFIDVHLAPYIAELDVPLHGSGLHLDNPFFGPMDAHVLYAMVRRARPRRVLELGSGYSSLLIERALVANANGSEPAVHVVVDPHLSPLLAHAPRQLDTHAMSAAGLPPTFFTGLRDKDILFVDTSHTVKPGGEVVRLVLEALPTLAPGVIVHFHDIFRPFEYPRVFYERYNVHWQEQYLLQAFLAFNPLFTVLCSNHALWRRRPDSARARFPGLREGMQPGSFWFRRVAATAPLSAGAAGSALSG